VKKEDKTVPELLEKTFENMDEMVYMSDPYTGEVKYMNNCARSRCKINGGRLLRN